METLEFKIDINANKEKVWDTMLQRETYEQWVSVSWPDSSYEGEWKQGHHLKFGTPGQGGTMAKLLELRPYEYVHAEHVAILGPDGSEDRDSEIAKDWIGCSETYSFTEKNGKTELKVQIKTPPSWADMFNDGWPAALAKLKELCES